MQTEIAEKLKKLIAKTDCDDIIWKRISPTRYTFEKKLPYSSERKLINSGEILYTMTKNEGNFLMSGHDIRYELEIVNKDNEETIYKIGSSKDSEEETRNILTDLYNSIESQQNRKLTTILAATL